MNYVSIIFWEENAEAWGAGVTYSIFLPNEYVCSKIGKQNRELSFWLGVDAEEM